MDLVKIINQLKRERDAVSDALSYLERLALAQGKHPESASDSETRTRKPFSAATKQRMAAAQKKRWAAYRKAKAGSA